MDDKDRNRQGQQGESRGRQDRSQQPQESGVREDEDLQREGNLGNERNRNQPDKSTGGEGGQRNR
jgi:hypothetical protein